MGKLVGQFIREMREKRNLSQGDVAKLLSLKTAQSISNIERGVSPLPRAKIKKLSEILGIAKAELMSVALREVQDRYARAAGVTGGALVIAPEGLAKEEMQLIQTLAAELRESSGDRKTELRLAIRKVMSGATKTTRKRSH
jgi:transcriptional regulator with XRE-family HTH domain